MNLTIATPLGIVVEAENVAQLRAEDETGAFGILPGHADFLTTLAVSVVTWSDDAGEQHVAVRGGVLSVRDGKDISIVTREAVSEDTLSALGDAVLTRMRAEQESEQTERSVGTRMELAAMRQIERYLAGGRNRFFRAHSLPDFPKEGGERSSGR
jgi:F-type H+-transporting ATPase subunit epsilon